MRLCWLPSLLFVLFAAGPTLAALRPLTEIEVAHNGNLEEGGTPGPAAWIPRRDPPTGVTLRWSETNPHSGRRCLGIESTFAEDRPWSWWEQSLKLTAGETYRIGAWVRSEKLSRGAVVLLVCQDERGKELLRQGLPAVPPDTGKWVSLERRLRAPAGTVKGRLQFSMHGAGRVYLDDLSVRVELKPEPLPWNRTTVYPVALSEEPRQPATGGLPWDDLPWARVDQAAEVSQAEAILMDKEDSLGSADLSFRFAARHTREALQLRVEVSDDARRLAKPYWQGDSLQLAFDTQYARRDRDDGPGEYALGVALAAGAPRVVLDHLPPGARLRPGDLAVACENTDRGYEVTLTLPWQSLGMTPPHHNQRLGLGLVVNDNDGRGRKWAEWGGGLARRKRPSEYGTLVFLTAGQLGVSLSPPLVGVTDLRPLSLAATFVSLSGGATVCPFSLKLGGETDRRTVALQPGVTRVPLVYAPGSVPAGRQVAQLTADCGESRVSFEVLPLRATVAEATERLQRISAEVDRLIELVRQGRQAQLEVALPDATLATAEHFLRFIPADLAREGHETLALNEARRLEPLVAAAIDETRQILAHPEQHPAQPAPDATQAVLRGGNWYVGDRPLFLLGFNQFDTAWLKDLPRFGGNFVTTVGGSAAYPFRNGPELDEDALQSMVARVREAAKYGLRSDVHFGHAMPAWAKEKWPDLTETEGHFMFYDLQHPEARRLTCAMMESVARALAEEPGVACYDLWNEAAYNQMSKRALEAFRQAMWRKYGQLDTAPLNAVWGTRYARFAEVNPVTRDPQQPAPYTDWVRWNNQRVSDYVAEMRAAVRRGDPDALTTVKFSNEACLVGTLNHAYRQQQTSRHNLGIDRWAMAQLLEVQGCDTRPTRLSPDYAFAWRYPGMAYDLQRSMAPDKPIDDSEWHGIQTVYFEQDDQPAEYLNAALWWSYLHGVDMNLTWWWSRAGTEPRTQWFAGSLLTQPQLLNAWARNSLLVQRFAPEAVAFQDTPARVRLLYSKPSAILDLHYLDTQRDAYETLNWFGVPLGFVTEEMLLAGFQDFDLLILPAAKHVSPGVRESVAKLAESGVTVAAIGDDCLTLTPHGNALTDPVPLTVVAVPNAKDSEALEKLLRQCHLLPALRCVGPDGQSSKPVEFRSVTVGGRTLAYYVGLGKQPATVELVQGDKPARWHSLLTGELVHSPVVVRPYDFDLLELE